MRIPDAMQPMLEVWRHRNYACFMGGMTPALITLWIQRVGVLWLAWELTKSNTFVGLVVAVDYAPMIVLAPFVGAFTEKANPVQVQKAAQIASLVIALAMGLLTYAGLMNIWVLLALSLALGCVHPFNAISRHTIVPATVPKENIPSALATDSALYNAARFIGPAMAGYLIDRYGAGLTFAVNAFGILFYLAGLYAMRINFSERTAHGHGKMLSDIAEGIGYVRRHPGIGPLFLLMTIGAIWVRPLQDLLPGFADRIFEAGPTGLGWLTAGMGVGATIAAGGIAFYGRTHGLTLTVLIAFAVNLVATVLFCATQWLWLAVIVAALWGGTLTLMSTGTQALVQSSVENSKRARVMSLYTMIYRGVPALGAIVIGWFADRVGLQIAFIFAALLCIPAWLVVVRKRASMTLALEGGTNNLDARLLAASKALAEAGYERMVEIKGKAGPLAGKVAAGTKAIGVRTRDVVRDQFARRPKR